MDQEKIAEMIKLTAKKLQNSTRNTQHVTIQTIQKKLHYFTHPKKLHNHWL